MATQAEVAAHLDLSVRWVRDLAKTGMLPRPEQRGEWNLDACRKAYLNHLQEKAAAKEADTKGLELREQQARLANARADALALRNDKSRARLVRREDVIEEVSRVNAGIRERVRQIPPRAAEKAFKVGSPAEVQDVIMDEVVKALEDLSGGDLD